MVYLTDKETNDAVVKDLKDTIEKYKKMKETFVCTQCNKEFHSHEECGEHAMEEHHYNFKLKGTNLTLGIL